MIAKNLNTILTVVVTILVFNMTLPAQAEDPSGTVTLESTSIALGIGVEWGHGTLTLNNGSTHKFEVKGISVVDLGISKVEATGDVFDLKNIADFPGDYSAVKAGATFAKKSAGDVILQNEKKVQIRLTPKGTGVQLTAGFGGVVISMK
jgi:hypothetical protein